MQQLKALPIIGNILFQLTLALVQVSVRKTGLSAASNLLMAFPDSVPVALLWVEAALPMVCPAHACTAIPQIHYHITLVISTLPEVCHAHAYTASPQMTLTHRC